ncbi:MAG: glycosyltransferase family 39 protein [Actinomycetes bacterium]
MSTNPTSTTHGRLGALRRLAGSPWVAGAFVLVLVAFSLWTRTKSIRSSFWMDEALSVGISSHDLMDIPHVLKRDGSPPFYYMLLSVWMGWFGRTEAATHALSVAVVMLAIPVGFWAGWRLFSKRAGLILATLIAVSVFLTQYAEETRMYSLVALLALLTTAMFCLAFVQRRRGWIAGFSVSLAALLYTHGWGLFFGIGCGLAGIYLAWLAEDRRPLIRDGLIGFGATAILFLPWLPTLMFQAAHTGAPWSSSPRLGVFSQLATLLGGWATAGALVIGGATGLIAIWKRQQGPGTVKPTESIDPDTERTQLVTIAIIITGTLAVAWIASQFNPAWSSRYMAAIICPILLFLAAGAARAGSVGIMAVVVAIALALVSPVDNTLAVKSNVRDIATNVRDDLRPGDLVISAQPEQTPLAWYYLPGGLKFADPMGITSDPRMLDWTDVVDRFRGAKPGPTYAKLIGSLPVGARILIIRPLTITRSNWVQPWTSLVRLRSAQWSGLLARDPHLVPLKAVPWFFISPSGVGNSAYLYEKKSAAG